MALAACLALVVADRAQDSLAPGPRQALSVHGAAPGGGARPLPATPMQGGALSSEEELQVAVLRLRETIVQLKEMLGAQR
ncbi:neuronal pentraxin-2-like [Macaca nemestrina]|uniref:neuronal pentraxin-2-like n=1 Tax=Macaca nemestrina TaxID=9545 RepID=UPI0039B83845